MIAARLRLSFTRFPRFSCPRFLKFYDSLIVFLISGSRFLQIFPWLEVMRWSRPEFDCFSKRAQLRCRCQALRLRYPEGEGESTCRSRSIEGGPHRKARVRPRQDSRADGSAMTCPE